MCSPRRRRGQHRKSLSDGITESSEEERQIFEAARYAEEHFDLGILTVATGLALHIPQFQADIRRLITSDPSCMRHFELANYQRMLDSMDKCIENQVQVEVHCTYIM